MPRINFPIKPKIINALKHNKALTARELKTKTGLGDGIHKGIRELLAEKTIEMLTYTEVREKKIVPASQCDGIRQNGWKCKRERPHYYRLAEAQ